MCNKRLRIEAQRHSYFDVPMRIPESTVEGASFNALRDSSTGEYVPVQPMEDGESATYCCILDRLEMGSSKTYELSDDFQSAETRVELVETGSGRIDILIGGILFTSYHYEGRDIVRPFLHPVIGPGGVRVTRGFPMINDVPGETTDHKHHRSIWVAHGDVNGADDWSEEDGCARIVHKAFLEMSSGPVFGRIRVVNDWVDNQGMKLLEEQRTITAYNLRGPDRIIDLDVVFRATEGDVKFGDTKEGGIVSVRVATSMDGDKGGIITNAFGGITEAENWGWPAHWCDYSGPVDSHTVGIAIFDNPRNFRYPTRWHVRDYGLFAANPFALSAYSGDPSIDGSHTVRKGELFPFSYRLYIHSGDARSAMVSEKYHSYINPPAISFEQD